jgi:hypothetical protein
MRRSFPTPLFAILLFPAFASAASSVDVACIGQVERLASHEGVYARVDLVERVRATRRWDLGQEDAGQLTELRIAADGSVLATYGWHEGERLERGAEPDCLAFSDDLATQQATTQRPATAFTKLASHVSPGQEDAPYFDLLFRGCFAEAGGERWCFRTNGVEIAGRERTAHLLLDLSELPAGGSLLQVAGEPQFWLLVPRGEGWAVHRTTWASDDGYVAPVWDKPWKVLNPAK